MFPSRELALGTTAFRPSSPPLHSKTFSRSINFNEKNCTAIKIELLLNFHFWVFVGFSRLLIGIFIILFWMFSGQESCHLWASGELSFSHLFICLIPLIAFVSNCQFVLCLIFIY